MENIKEKLKDYDLKKVDVYISYLSILKTEKERAIFPLTCAYSSVFQD